MTTTAARTAIEEPDLAGLRALSRAAIAAIFAHSPPVAIDALVGWRCRGITLGLPALAERAAWSVFAKDIVRDGDSVVGHNVRLVQPRVRDAATLATCPLTPLTSQGADACADAIFGRFRVVTDARGGALLDYRGLGHPPPLAWMVDPLVRLVCADGVTRFLGVSELVLGQRRLPTPTWFVLQPEVRLAARA
jgi:hypothetical protein